MKRFRWQLIIIFLTGLVVGFLLLGEQPNQQSIGPEPTSGGIYAEALIGSFERLNPLLDFNNPADRDVDSLLYSGLVRFDERGLPQPDLADSWGVSKDGTIYNFTLRSGIKWHDGEILTTDDVQFTIDLIRDGGSIIPQDLKDFWKDIDVKVLSPTAIQFRLPEPFAPFLDYLSFSILPKHQLGEIQFDEMVQSPFNLQPIGSGPYRFDRLIVENGQIIGVVLTRFDDTYGQKPFIDQMIFRYYPNSSEALKAYEDGIVQGIGHVTTDILAPVLAIPDLSIYTGRMPELSLVMFNLNDPKTPFFQDMKVRKALLSGLNRQWMADRILGGQAIVADGPILPGTWAYYDGLERVEYDPDQAKISLKEAGYEVTGDTETVRKKGETEFSFELLYPDDSLHKALAEYIQKSWEALDIKVILTPVSYDELVNQRLQERSYQAALVDMNLMRTPDPDPYPFWDQAQASGGQNYSQWDNRVASEYLETARTTINLDERTRLYRNFQVIFSDELPALPLYYPVYSYAVDKQVQGVRMGPIFDTSDRFLTVPDWFLIARKTTRPTTVVNQP